MGSEIKSLTLRDEAAALLDYWRDERGGDDIPHRKSMSPLRLRRWVGDISVVQLHDGPKRFFVSLHGANVGRHIGPDFNREYLEDAVPPGSLSVALAPYLDCIEHRQPTYSIMIPTFNNGLHSKLERMLLPFSGDDPAQIDRFLVWVAPNDRDPAAKKSVYSDGSDSLTLFRLRDAGPEQVMDQTWETGDSRSESYVEWRQRRTGAH